MIRRLSIFHMIGGAIMGGDLAYIVTYEPVSIKKIPDMIMNQIQRKQGSER